jgi:hypothetical protein
MVLAKTCLWFTVSPLAALPLSLSATHTISHSLLLCIVVALSHDRCRHWSRRGNNDWFARDALEHGLAQRRVRQRRRRTARQQRVDGAGRALVGGGERAQTQGERVRGTQRR